MLALAALPFAPSVRAQNAESEPAKLEVGKPIERELKGGERDVYSVELDTGYLLDAVVEQKGIDVVVTVLGPDGKKLAEIDGPTGDSGPEEVEFVAAASGLHQLVVSPLESGSRGKYVARALAIRAATATDRMFIEAVGLRAESDLLYADDKPDFERIATTKRRVVDLLRLSCPSEKTDVLVESELQLALLEGQLGHQEPALQLAREVVGLYEKRYGSGTSELFDALLALTYRFGFPTLIPSRAQASLPPLDLLYLRAEEIAEKKFPPNSEKLARVLCFRGKIAATIRDDSRADILLTRALEVAESAYGTADPRVGIFTGELANFAKDSGDVTRARTLYARGIQLYETSKGSEYVDQLGVALSNLAVIDQDAGRYRSAETLFLRALALYEGKFGATSEALIPTLNGLANNYFRLGDFRSAEDIHRRTLEIALHAKPGDVSRARGQYAALMNLGNLAIARGDFQAADEYFEQVRVSAAPSAMTNSQELVSSVQPDVARSLAFPFAGLSEVAVKKGEFARAEALLEQTLKLYDIGWGADWISDWKASSIESLGEVYQKTSRLDAAESEFEKAITSYEKIDGPDHPDVARALQKLARARIERGSFASAEDLLRRALEIRTHVLGADHPEVAVTLYDLAQVRWARGNVAEAAALFEQAETVREHNIARNVDVGSDRQKGLYVGQFEDEQDLLISFAAIAPRDTGAVNLALASVLARKARSLDATAAGLAALRERAAPADRPLFDDLADTRSELATLVMRGPGKLDRVGFVSAIEALERRVDQIESDVSARAAGAAVRNLPVSIDAVRNALPPAGALVEVVRFRTWAPASPGTKASQHYAAFVLARANIPRLVDLGEVKAIDAATNLLRAALGNPGRRDAGELSRALDERVMRPIRAVLTTDVRQLILSPDGALNLVPFAALRDEHGSFLVERYLISVVTSGRDLMRIRQDVASRSGPVIVANPDYSGTDAIAEARGANMADVRFGSLPGTQTEATALERVLSGATVFAREQATETMVKHVTGPLVLHVATHGFYVDESRDRKPAVLSGFGNPLLRSGLALAGANRRNGGNGEDGILTALEASGLDLWGTKLVVLSACDTGLGEVRAGEGVYGLRRALVLAGSETQVMSLWSVDDSATRELMVAYYTELLAGAGRAEAMRRVQLKMLKDPKRRHPAFWAGFIVSGDWRPLLKSTFEN